MLWAAGRVAAVLGGVLWCGAAVAKPAAASDGSSAGLGASPYDAIEDPLVTAPEGAADDRGASPYDGVADTVAPEQPEPATWIPAFAGGPTAGAEPGGCAPLQIHLPDVPVGPDDPPVPEIVDAHRLEPFFERAARLIRGFAPRHVRIAVFGDSNHTMDFITGRMRRLLQLRYGDAGHGFVALGRPWDHYRHMDVRHEGRSGFEVYAVTTNPVFDQGYGLSGIAAESLWRNAQSWVATAEPPAPIGRSASSAEVYFLRMPWFGPLEVRVNGERRSVIDTRGPKGTFGHYRVELEDGPVEVRCVAASARRPIRLLGAMLERSEPGFVIDSFGVGALNTKSLARENPAVNRAMLRHRRYDLAVFMVGANDEFTFDEAPAAMQQVIDLHREALPLTPILLVSPPDRGRKQTAEAVPKLVEQRRQIAAANGCAYWDLWRAMGAEGAMKRLRARGLVRFDYTHFNEAGGAYVADRFVHALWRELARYARSKESAGCDRTILYDRR
jgi:lysophospholipase L1-like esterase